MKKILIVDDDLLNRKLVASSLKKNKVEFYEAENGLEALNKVKEKEDEIGLIFLDLIMPVMDGFTFMRNIKDLKINIPIIVLTTDDSKRKEALKLGAKEVIIKPVSPIIIGEVIKKYL